MIRNPREKEFPPKQESSSIGDGGSASSRLWPGLRNPRIVRVSRAFGGKDRHSKVSTVRGLRDRRVRLSVPTAIQLYDLQDRLGVNQPSKVVDWLLTAAQHEIDKLPPLQMPPGNLIHFSQPMVMNPNDDQLISPPDSPSLNANPRQVEIINQVENQENHSFPILPHSTNSYYHWDSTMMSAYNSSQVEGTSGNSVIPAASFFQGANPSMFLPYMMNTEFDPRTLQFGMASSAATQTLGLNSMRAYRLPGGSGMMRSFQPNLGSKHQSSEEHDEN